jgi:Tfp pilus assembly protein PilF
MSTPFRTKDTSGRSSAEDHLQAARDALTRGDRAGALQALDQAVQVSKGDLRAAVPTARTAFEWGELEVAQRVFRDMLLQRLDDAAPITKAEVFYYLGAIAARQGEKAKAVNMLERALDSDPTFEAAESLLRTIRG